jgi:hypothetical protein
LRGGGEVVRRRPWVLGVHPPHPHPHPHQGVGSIAHRVAIVTGRESPHHTCVCCSTRAPTRQCKQHPPLAGGGGCHAAPHSCTHTSRCSNHLPFAFAVACGTHDTPRALADARTHDHTLPVPVGCHCATAAPAAVPAGHHPRHPGHGGPVFAGENSCPAQPRTLDHWGHGGGHQPRAVGRARTRGCGASGSSGRCGGGGGGSAGTRPRRRLRWWWWRWWRWWWQWRKQRQQLRGR